MKRTLVIRLMAEVDEGKVAKLPSVLDQVAVGAVKSLRVFGIKALGHETELGMPTREEAIRLTPRRIHYGASGWTACDRETAAGRTVLRWEKVDCKMCLKKKPQGVQKEMF